MNLFTVSGFLIITDQYRPLLSLWPVGVFMLYWIASTPVLFFGRVKFATIIENNETWPITRNRQ